MNTDQAMYDSLPKNDVLKGLLVSVFKISINKLTEEVCPPFTYDPHGRIK